jgi:hypothetical protein
MTTRHENIWSAMGWMIGLSILLFWLPLLGGLIAGFVGGRKAGSVGSAAVAVFLPGIIFLVISAVVGALLGWIPIIGQLWAAVAGIGAWALSFMHVIPLVVGAVIGGATARR